MLNKYSFDKYEERVIYITAMVIFVTFVILLAIGLGCLTYNILVGLILIGLSIVVPIIAFLVCLVILALSPRFRE